MSGGGDLYKIGLDPQRAGQSLPGDVATRGSIGGSDVGANARDDQRVRDLIESYMEEYQILNQLNILNSDPCIDGWLLSAAQTIQNLDEGASGTGGTYTSSHTITIPTGITGYIKVHISAMVEFYYDADATAGQANTILTATLYIDGVASNITMEWWLPHAETLGYTWFYEVPFAFTGIVVDTTTVAAGDHTFKILWEWSVAPGFGGSKANNSVGMYIHNEFCEVARTCITDVDPA